MTDTIMTVLTPTNPFRLGLAALAAVTILTTAFLIIRKMVKRTNTVEQAAKTGAKGLGDTATAKIAVYAAALIAETMSMDGVHHAFSTAFHGDNLATTGGFVVFTAAALVEAMRASRVYRLTGSIGVDFWSTWALAATGGTLAAMAETTPLAAAGRLVLALVAALLWFRGMILDRRAITATTREADKLTLHWRITPARILVALRLASPAEQDLADQIGQRRAQSLARISYRLEMARTAGHKRRAAWLESRRRTKLYRSDATTIGRARRSLAAIYQADELLSPDSTKTIKLDLVGAAVPARKANAVTARVQDAPQVEAAPAVAPQQPARTLPPARPVRQHAADNAAVLERLRMLYPDTLPSLTQVEEVAKEASATGKCGRSRVVSLRRQLTSEREQPA